MAHPTKIYLKESLKKLISQKPLNKITVSDITNDSGVNRMTFYYHFKDVSNLIEWSIMQDAENSLGSDLSFKKWQDGLLKIFYAIRHNKEFFSNINANVDKKTAEGYINKHMKCIAESIVKEITSKSSISNEFKARISTYYEYCLTSMVICWMEGNFTEEPEFLVEYASALLKKGMSGTIEKLYARQTELER